MPSNITDLTGTKWRFNETIQYDSSFPTYSINYKAYYNSGANYDEGTTLYMTSYDEGGRPPIAFYGLRGEGLSNFSGGFFSYCIYEGYLTTSMTPTSMLETLDYIEITGGTDATNANLISWIQSNAEQIIEPAGQTLTLTLTNGTLTSISETLTPSAIKYAAPSTVTVSGATSSYTPSTGVLNLTSPTSNVSVTAEAALAPKRMFVINGYVVGKVNGQYVSTIDEAPVQCGKVATYSITKTITNGTASGASTIDANTTATVTIAAGSNYNLPSTITVNGVTGSSGSTGVTWSYNSGTGVVSLSNPTANVTISAACESAAWGGTDLTGTTWEFTNNSSTNFGKTSSGYAMPGPMKSNADKVWFVTGTFIPLMGASPEKSIF